MPWTAAGARKASAAVEGYAVGTLGPALVAAIGETPAAGELRPAVELGPTISMAPGVDVLVGEWGPGVPAVKKNELLQSSPLSGLRESNLRGDGFFENWKDEV